MINVNDILKIVEDSKKMEHDVRVGDISYVLLLRQFKEHKLAYAVVFDKDASQEDVDKYDKSAKFKFLKKYMNANYPVEDKKPKNSKYKDITFDENKDALIEKLAEIEDAKLDGTLDVKDALKLEVDIRTRLNDKFAVSEKQDEQRIIVETKFNTICPHTRKECWVQTKEFAMEHWNLIPNPEVKEEEQSSDKDLNL